MAVLDPWFLEILACPVCQESLKPTPDSTGLVCEKCALVYPIEDGIPQLLPDSGRPLGGNRPGPATP